MIKTALTEKRKEYYELFTQYEEFIKQETVRMSRLDSLVEQIRLERRQIDKLTRQLGLEDRQINKEKFERVVQDVKKGLLVEGRIDITAKGSKKRTRISIQTMMEYL